MFDYIAERVIREGEYIIETGDTVRATAVHFNISKSTVHKDVTERLLEIDKKLYEEVRLVLEKNLSERHIRGGLATKEKYANVK
ncbi:MAG: sporulation transcriptional regulator SpoIIID [Clostridia bacterium]|nr:sporulation transcriptional regulator SpoIIID [Clostridia bacterium]